MANNAKHPLLVSHHANMCVRVRVRVCAHVLALSLPHSFILCSTANKLATIWNEMIPSQGLIADVICAFWATQNTRHRASSPAGGFEEGAAKCSAP
eukprot:1156316-Pelagomonas_calceolata.AAC.2